MKRSPKLSLRKQTLKVLTPTQLREVGGGAYYASSGTKCGYCCTKSHHCAAAY